jgi:hypothetical protein
MSDDVAGRRSARTRSSSAARRSRSRSRPTRCRTIEKLQSLRSNNEHFCRATVHHELIPGHWLQQYSQARHRTYRGPFDTPFWIEGWALYWEMRLYDLGLAQEPRGPHGMLYWRKHRCARIVFSLNFHLGKWTGPQCVEYLIDRVGHERAAAEGEVRRSVSGGYGPLYQAAYMLGGLQMRALHASWSGGWIGFGMDRTGLPRRDPARKLDPDRGAARGPCQGASAPGSGRLALCGSVDRSPDDCSDSQRALAAMPQGSRYSSLRCTEVRNTASPRRIKNANPSTYAARGSRLRHPGPGSDQGPRTEGDGEHREALED